MSDVVTPPVPYGRQDFRAIRTRARRYWETIRWLVGQIFRFDRRRFLLVVYLAFIGRSVQAAALAILFFVAHGIEQDRTLQAAGMAIHFRDPDKLLAGVLTAGVLLVLGAVLIFHGKKVLVDVAADFGDACSRDVLLIDRTIPISPKQVPGEVLSVEVRRAAIGAFQFARAGMAVLTVLSPLTTLVFAIGALIYLSPVTALGLLFIVLPASALFYLINVRAVQNQRTLVTASSRRKRAILAFADKVARDDRPGSVYRGAAETAFAGPAIGAALDGFKHRLLATTRAEYVANFVIAAAATALVIYLGLEALQGATTWTVLLSTVVALRFVLMALRGVVVSITQYARFHPAVRSLYELMLHSVPRGPLAVSAIKVRSNWDQNAVAGLEGAVLQRGAPTAMVSPVRLGRFGLHAFARDLAGRGRRLSARQILAASTCVAGLSVPATPFRLADMVDAGARANALQKLAQLREIMPTLPDLDAVIDEEAFRALKPPRRATILIAAAALCGADVVFVDAGVIEELPQTRRGRLLSALADRFVVTTYRADAATVCRFGEQTALVSDGMGQVAAVDPPTLVAGWPDVRERLWAVGGVDEEADTDELDDEP